MAQILTLEDVNRRLLGGRTTPPPSTPTQRPAAQAQPSVPGRFSIDDINTRLSQSQTPQRRASQGPVDTETGAPSHVRAVVGAAPEEGRLETLRNFFPDAQPAIIDPTNFVFTNPETGRLTLYNPKGFDTGDVASLALEAGQVVGGTLGTMGGVAVGTPAGPAGIVAGGMAGAGFGGTAGGELVRQGLRATGLLEDPRTLPEAAVDVGVETMLGAAGEGIGMGVGKVARGAVKHAFRGGAPGKADMQSAIAEFATFGARPSVGQATRKRSLDSAEAFLARVPGGSKFISEQVKDTVAKAHTRINRLAGALSPTTFEVDEEIAGRMVTGDIENRFLPQFRAKADALFRRVDETVPPDAGGLPNATLDALDDLAGIDQAAPTTSRTSLVTSPALRRLSDAIGSDVLTNIAAGSGTMFPLAVLQRLRKRIGQKLSSTDLIVNVDRGELKQLYKAITDDIEQTLRLQDSSGKALKAFRRANRFYRAGVKRVDDFLGPLTKKRTAQEAFEAVETDNGEALRSIRKSMDPAHWRSVAALTLRRLGLPDPVEREGTSAFQPAFENMRRPGVDRTDPGFDMERFLARWNDLTPRVKTALFEGHPQMGTMKRDLDIIANAARRVRENQEAFTVAKARAGTTAGVTLTGVAAGSAVLGHPGLALALMTSAMGMAGAAKAMTSPRFVSWLARSTRVAPNRLGAHIGRLGAIASSEPDPETRDAILGYLNTLGSVASGAADLERPLTAPAATPPP